MNLLSLKSDVQYNYPNIVFTDTSPEGYLCLEFDLSQKHEFKYYIWAASDFTSVQVGATPTHESTKPYFWYYPFDIYDEHSDKFEGVKTFVFEVLEILTNFPTRITQKRGILTESFKCEYLKENEWISLYGHSAFKFGGFRFPQIDSRKNIYE